MECFVLVGNKHCLYAEEIGWYEGESISNQPNLFPVEIHLFFFDVVASSVMHLDQRCSSAISLELKMSEWSPFH